MIELAVCDDELALRRDLRRILEQELELSGLDFCITEYESGEALLFALEEREFDIFFLDIEMKELNGMETAARIRKKTRRSEIIFVTSFSDFVFQGYEVRASNYILKPYEDKKIRSALHSALDVLGLKTEDYYIIEQRAKKIKLPLDTILYFMSERHQVTAFTSLGSHSFYGTLSEVEAALKPPFLRIHSRYLVNLSHVDAIEGNSVLIKREKLPVSRPLKQALSIAFAKYSLRQE